MDWFINAAKFGFIVGVSEVPVVSNLPTHIPFNFLLPNLNAGCVLYSFIASPFDSFVSLVSKTISIEEGVVVPPVDILYLYLGIHTKYAKISLSFITVPAVAFK